MAKANVEAREVEKVVTTEENVYVLELTEQEAKALFALVGQVSGIGEVRTVTTSIYTALKKTGLKTHTVLKNGERHSVDMHGAEVVPGLVWGK